MSDVATVDRSQPGETAPARRDGRIDRFARWYSSLNELALSILAIIMALVIGALVIGVSTGQPTLGLTAYQALFTGSFGSWSNVAQTFTQSIPLVLAALAVAFAFRGGLFNIGAEGQLYAGAIAATAVGVNVSASGVLLLPLCIVAGMATGAVWGLLPGILKAYRGAHEVITTMMLNYVGLYLLNYCVESGSGQYGPLQNPLLFGNPESKPVNAFFPYLPFFGSQLTSAVIMVLICCAAFSFLLWRTTLGYRVRAVGFNLKAARAAGVKVNRNIVAVMAISGAFAGAAGMSYVFAYNHYLNDNFDGFTIGFYGIAVALLGRNTAIGAILAGILFGALQQGGIGMQFAGVDENIIGLIEGLIIFFVGADALVRFIGAKGVGFLPLWRSKPGPMVPAEGSPV